MYACTCIDGSVVSMFLYRRASIFIHLDHHIPIVNIEPPHDTSNNSITMQTDSHRDALKRKPIERIQKSKKPAYMYVDQSPCNLWALKRMRIEALKRIARNALKRSVYHYLKKK